MVLDADTVRTMMGMLQGPRISDDAWIHDVVIVENDEGIDVTISVGTQEKPNVPIAEAKQDLFTKLGARPDVAVRVAMDQPSTRRIVARTAEIAGYGWSSFAPAPLAHPVEVTDPEQAPVVLANGLVQVEIDRSNGTFALDGLGGYGRLVDGGDLGDSYNYSPPRQDSFVDTPQSVVVLVTERGPVRGRARITTSYAWPDHVDGSSQARVGEHLVEVVTDIELRADDRTVRVTTSFVNPSGDHRLRVHLPLPEPATESHAESAFTVVTRGLTAEGRSDEFGLPTAPAQRFVTAGRLTVAHEGVCEYELIDIGDDGARTLALTVVRSTGMLSRLGMVYRPFPAGPMTAVEGLQMRGKRVTLRYGLALDCEDPYGLADDVLLPLETTASFGGGTRPAAGTELTIHGAEVSALHREGGVIEVRVFNPTGQAAVVALPGRSGWLVDLRGYPTAPFEGSFELRPFGIATARLRDD
jgi:alpha-mannosidase